jgi:hypothetical protein
MPDAHDLTKPDIISGSIPNILASYAIGDNDALDTRSAKMSIDAPLARMFACALYPARAMAAMA